MKSINKVLLAVALVAGTGYTYAKPNITVKTSAASEIQDRHLSGFNAVEVAGSFDVILTQGTNESVKVEAPSDVMDKIITEVDGGVLKIHDKHNSGWNWGSWWGGRHKKIVIYVTARDLNSIGVTGSGDVSFKNGIHTNTLNIRVTGSGDVIGRIDVKKLETVISGSGDVKLSGRAGESNVSVSGSGDYSSRDLATENTAVRVSGSGDASINASNNLDVAVSGSGDVSYTGSPKHVSKSKSGSGDISGH